MIRGILFHSFKGKPHTHINKALDVAKIDGMYITKRKFVFKDRNLPYVLSILYAEPKENLDYALGGGFGFVTSFYSRVKLTQNIFLRYESLKDAEKEMSDVEQKQEKLQKITDKVLNLAE